MEDDLFFFKVNKFIESTRDKKNSNSYIEIGTQFNRETVLNKFYKIYNSYENLDVKSRMYKSFFKHFAIPYISLIFIRIFITVAEFGGPLLMGRILGISTKSEGLTVQDKFNCYFTVMSFILLTFTRIVMATFYGYRLNMIKDQLWTIIPDLLYKKILRLNSSDDSIKTEAEVSKILNEEISYIYRFFINMNYSWELPFCILFALYSTYLQVDFAFIPGFLFAISLLYLNYKIAISISKTNENLHNPRLKRKENELVAIKNIKNVKFFNMEKYFLESIYYYRKEELGFLTFKKNLDSLCCYLWAASPILISFFSIFSYILAGKLIDAEKVFTTISLLNMTIHPLNVFPWIFAQMKGSMKSFENIINLLSKEEKCTLKLDTDSKKELVCLENVKLKHKIDSDYELTITNDNPLKIQKGKLTILYGANGTGKTLLINSLMGETFINKIDSDSIINIISVDQKISYVPQELCTFNMTLKENVSLNFENEVNVSNFIENCCLDEDLNRMPDGENTIISCKGSNISGGQKQRVNIARALCNNPDILLLDNPFSSIDNNIAIKIFEKAILPLKNKDVSIILATSDSKYLKYGDYLYILENKTLIEEKNLNELQLNKYIDYDYQKNSMDKTIEKNDKTEEQKSPDEATEEQAKRVKFETYKFYFGNTGYLFFTIVLIFVALMQFGRNFIEIWLADWVKSDNLTLEQKESLQKRNTYYYLLFVILHSIFTTGRSYYYGVAGLKACRLIYENFIEKLLYAKHKFFTKNDTGVISNMLQQDILTIDEWVPFEMNRLLAYTFGLFGSVFVIIFSSYLSVLLFIPVAFYYVNLFKDYNPASRLLSKKMKKVNEPFLNLYYDTIEGKTVIRACRKEQQFINKLHFYIEKFIRILHTEQCLGFWLSLRLDLLAFYIYSFIMILIGFCIHQGQYDVITILSLALTYAMNITSPLSNFLPWITYTEEQFYSVERVLDKINEIGDEKNIKINEKSISYNPFECNENKILEFKNVNLKYDQTSDILALNDISFQVFKAQKIAIIGRTGAGKSSIFSSIFRIYDIDDGLIRFNNVDIKDIELEILRKEISVVPKDVLILEGTVKSNIDFLSLYSDEYFSEFMSIFADIFGTKPEFELFTKNLFTYKIENGGTNLSEGQKCLIQIFRCIIRKSKLICLDESNGELDDDTEEKLFNILFEKFNHTTFIVIAHKLNILNKFDNILVIEGGKIAECGTPSMILNKN